MKLLSKLNINQNINVTKKMIIIICGSWFIVLFTLLLIISLISFHNSDKNKLIYDSYVELEKKISANDNANNTYINSIKIFENRLNQIELEQKKINVDYDNLNTRSARSQQDITSLQLILNDQNLESRLDNFETTITNLEVELENFRNIQKNQQDSVDEIITSNEQFKTQIIQKITMMLSNINNNSVATTRKINAKASLVNFKYQLSSIELRAGDLVAVFLPKNASSLSGLKFVNEGDYIDSWKVTKIDKSSVNLINNQQQTYTITMD